MSQSRFANWLEMDDDKLFFWHHTPKKNSKTIAVVIIGPVGPEYMHCFRSIKYLAEKLAQSGHHCIRYDPIGMGNSSGILESNGIWQKWVKSPIMFTEYFKSKLDIDDIVFIGLRSGCLVLAESLKKVQLKAAVFWYPYTRGAAFIRDIQIIDSILINESNTSKGKTLEGGGYPLTEELQISIKKLNLLADEYTNIQDSLVIESKETTSKSKLYAKINDSEANVESIFLDGLDAMTKQAAISKIPHDNITIIDDWINKLSISKTDVIKSYINEQKSNVNKDFKESTLVIDDKNTIFSVLTTPIINSNDTIVIIVNSGSAHHVGPNRFHVDTARALAKKGISTLRIDISNLGESSENYEQDANHPYPEEAPDDINLTVNYIAEHYSYKNIILCGLCSGAHNIFHAALSSSNDNLKKIIIINPLTFYWKTGQSIFAPEDHQTEIEEVYYQKQMYSYKKWVKLITNPEKIFNIIHFLFLFSIKKIKSLWAKFKTMLHIQANSVLENDIEKLGGEGISISLIYSKDDPGQKILMSSASGIIKKHSELNIYTSTMITDADHTFSSRKSRKKLLEAIINTIIE